MRQRCKNPNRRGAKNYIGRGIKVCARWLKFENFLADLGECPPGMELDRFPNAAGNYEPGNVRWATEEQQQNNRRSNKRLTIGEETHTYAEWERINGLPRGIVKQRIAAGVEPKTAVSAKSNRGVKLCG